MAHSYDVTFVKVFIIWLSNDQKKHDTYYTQEVVLYQSDFYHPDNILNNTTTILNNPTTNAGLPMATAFQCVAMDLKFYRRVIPFQMMQTMSPIPLRFSSNFPQLLIS